MIFFLVNSWTGDLRCQVTAHCSTVNRRVGNQSVQMTIYMIGFFNSGHFILDQVQF